MNFFKLAFTAALLGATTLSGLSASALTMDEARVLVRDNKFSCGGKYSEFKLKPFKGDKVSNYAYFSFFLPQRESYTALNCVSVLQYLYFAGQPELFQFLDQVESISKMSGGFSVNLAALLDQMTVFKSEDREKVKKKLLALGVDFEDPSIRLNSFLVNFRPNAMNEAALAQQAEELTLALRSKQIHLRRPDIFADSFVLPYRRALIAEFRVKTLKLETLARAMKPLVDEIEKQTQDYEISDLSGREYGREDYWSLVHLLYLNNRAHQIHKLQKVSLNYALASLLTISDEEKKREALTAFTDRLYRRDERYTAQNVECKLLAGEAFKTQNFALKTQLFSIFRILTCSTDQALINGAMFNGELDSSMYREARFTDGVTKSIDIILKDLVRSCAEPINFGINRNDGELLVVATEAKCKPLIQYFTKSIQDVHQGSGTIERLLKNSQNPDTPVIREVVRNLLSTMPKGDIHPAALAEIENKLGKGILRQLDIYKRVESDHGRELLVAADQHDSDEVVNLKWNSEAIELDRKKLNSIQIQMIDRIRMSQTTEEAMFAVTTALIDTQAQARRDNTSKALLASVMNEFVAKAKSGLNENLSASKEFLDQVVSRRSGRYNFEATSLLDVVSSGRMQCTSGTDFMLLNVARTNGLQDQNKYAVAIFQPQHVLPGIFDAKAQKFLAIESTAEGKAIVNLILKDKQLPENNKVVLADDYLILKVLESALKDASLTERNLSARAEKVLGIRQGQITEKAIAPSAGTSTGGNPKSDGLNNSIFSFGRANIPSGDVPRAKLDVVAAGTDATQLSNLGRPRGQNQGSALSRFPVRARAGNRAAPAPTIMAREYEPAYRGSNRNLIRALIRESGFFPFASSPSTYQHLINAFDKSINAFPMVDHILRTGETNNRIAIQFIHDKKVINGANSFLNQGILSDLTSDLKASISKRAEHFQTGEHFGIRFTEVSPVGNSWQMFCLVNSKLFGRRDGFTQMIAPGAKEIEYCAQDHLITWNQNHSEKSRERQGPKLSVRILVVESPSRALVLEVSSTFEGLDDLEARFFIEELGPTTEEDSGYQKPPIDVPEVKKEF